MKNHTGKLLVELQIKTDFPISKSSVAASYMSQEFSVQETEITIGAEVDRAVSVDGQKTERGDKVGTYRNCG
jgi:phospholipid/cholesterol/gamma-HCH transport system substrate-binding protein